jgi:alpha-amylase/alpha-mannosidase (GH57 family)
MRLWHLTPDAARLPARVCPAQPVELWVGTWPIAPDQAVWVEYTVLHPDGAQSAARVEAGWHHNQGPNSYWHVRLGPFADGETVRYSVFGRSPDGAAEGPTAAFCVGPKIHLALLWHHHQPLYLQPGGRHETYRFPWVRLHAIRDYYAMAALVAQYPRVHVTINLVPSLLQQLDGYLTRHATDHALELTRIPAGRLTSSEQTALLSSFFDADWHHQIYIYPRYKALFEQRLAGRTFSTQDLTDLQMWFNLAWFAPELLEAPVRLHDGTRIDLASLVRKGQGFTRADLRAMLEAQDAIMRNVVPLHRSLQDAGQIEISTSPFYHPILPLIHDTDLATIDRPGAQRPARFHAPEDADAHVRQAAQDYAHRFGHRPRGMWPAEGAVGASIVRYFAHAGVRWIASDEGVLARSGRWGYRVEDPDVRCQPYRAVDAQGVVSIFFRDRRLSDAIGFTYQAVEDQAQAANAFLQELKQRLADHVSDPANRVVAVILDGENAWGAYRHAGRPLLHALYHALSEEQDVKTVTFSEYLDGHPARAVPPHPVETQPTVAELFHGSWIDEEGSAPGVDLGTWIGEEEENRAWELLRATREQLKAAGATPESHPAAFQALYAAEGSDWFWWFGRDQDSGYDEAFDDLFRSHLRSVYRALGCKPHRAFATHIVPHTVVWTFTRPCPSIQPRDRLTIRTNCAGLVQWSIDGWRTVEQGLLAKAGGVMAGLHSYALTLGPFPTGVSTLEFEFQCTECACGGQGACCAAGRQQVRMLTKGPS